MQDKIKTAKVVMGRAVQMQEQQMMQEREREYNQALDQTMDQQRLQVSTCQTVQHVVWWSFLTLSRYC